MHYNTYWYKALWACRAGAWCWDFVCCLSGMKTLDKYNFKHRWLLFREVTHTNIWWLLLSKNDCNASCEQYRERVVKDFCCWCEWVDHTASNCKMSTHHWCKRQNAADVLRSDGTMHSSTEHFALLRRPVNGKPLRRVARLWQLALHAKVGQVFVPGRRGKALDIHSTWTVFCSAWVPLCFNQL